MEVDQRISYTQHILRGAALQKNKAILMECKQLVKYLAGDKWTLGDFRALYAEDFWTWDKSDRLVYNGMPT